MKKIVLAAIIILFIVMSFALGWHNGLINHSIAESMFWNSFSELYLIIIGGLVALVFTKVFGSKSG